MDDRKNQPLVFAWGAWSENMMVPVPLVNMKDIQRASDGDIEISQIIPVDTLTFIIDNKSRLWVWGYDGSGRLGLGPGVDHASKPTMIDFIPVSVKEMEGKRNIRQISVGSSHVLALTESGDVYAWGSNAHGQLGIANFKEGTPTKVVIGLAGKELKAQQILCVRDSSFAVCDESVYAWGFNEDGNLGLNNLIPTELPTKIPALEKVSVDQLIENGQRVYAIVKYAETYEEGKDEVDDVIEELAAEQDKKNSSVISKGPSRNTSMSMNSSARVSRRHSEGFQKIEKTFEIYNAFFSEINTTYDHLKDFDKSIHDTLFSSEPMPLKVKRYVNELNRYAEFIYLKSEELDLTDFSQAELSAKHSLEVDFQMLKDALTLRKIYLLYGKLGPYFDYLEQNSFEAKSEAVKNAETPVDSFDLDVYCRYACRSVTDKLADLSRDFNTLHFGESDLFAHTFHVLNKSLERTAALFNFINETQYKNLHKLEVDNKYAQVTEHANEIWRCMIKLQAAKLHKLKERYVYNEGHDSFDDYCIDLFVKSDQKIRIVESQLNKYAKSKGKAEFSEVIKKMFKIAVDNIELMKLANEASRAAMLASK